MSNIHISIGSKSEILKLPTWKELRDFVPMDIFLTMSPFVIKTWAASHLLKKYKPTPAQVAQVSQVIDFDMSDLSDFDLSNDHTFRLNGREYHICRQQMENSTMREFIISDDFLSKYVEAINHQKPAEDHLYHLMGAMCRPQRLQKNPGDRRIPLLNIQHAKSLGAVFKRHARSLANKKDITLAAMICLYTALSTKNFIAKTYMPHLSGGENTGSRSIDFGWHTIVMDIAENGAFGTIEEVYNTNLHDIMVFCVKKALDAAAQVKNSIKPTNQRD